MPEYNIEISDNILAQLRKIVRAMEIQSRQLQRECALTSPQLVLLREIVLREETAIGTLASHVSLSNATVTGIVDRLEQRGLVVRNRNAKDRRQVLISSTEAGRALCQKAPPLMQEKFLTALSRLQDWEQTQMLAALSRLAAMMNGGPAETTPAKDLDAPEDFSQAGFLASCQMLLEQESGTERKLDAREQGLAPTLVELHSDNDFPLGISRETLAHFLNEYLRPYEDSVEDILSGLDYALSDSQDKSGFIVLALLQERLVGAVVILNTGMGGYVPEHLLLFVAVDASMRGRGVGARLIRHAQQMCTGDIKLHVDYDNPARRLYERMGFLSKYAEMRWKNESCNNQP